MTAFVVSSGQTSSGIILNSGDTLSVLSGGVTSNTLVHSGGTEIVFSGGLDHSAVLSGGTLDIFGGAVVSGATVASGGTLVLDNGAVASSTDGGATLHVLSGGTSVGTIVNSGGTIDVTGASATLVFAGDVTFDNATIDLGDAAGATVQADGVLTFGSNAVVTHTAGTGILTDDEVGGRAIINSGVISAVAPSGTLDITPETFTNSGTITVRNGDHVLIQPYGGAGAFTNFNNGQLTGGTYDIGSGSILELGLNQFVTTLDATLTLGGNGAKLQTFNGAGEIQIDQSLSTIGAGGALHIQGDALDNFGNLTINGTLQVQDDAVVAFGDLTDGGTIELGGGTSVNDIAIQGTRAITLDPTSGHQVVVAGTISDEVGTGAGPGVGSVIAAGGGYVELDGVANSFTGGVSVTGSGTTLAISDDANLGNGGTLALGSGTTLELFFGASPTYTITHSITLAGAVEFRADAGVSATIAGAIGGAGPLEVGNALAVGGGGTLVLGNAGNGYTGAAARPSIWARSKSRRCRGPALAASPLRR
jgi:autotransporter passenger strand-loop-strand repeat protein